MQEHLLDRKGRGARAAALLDEGKAGEAFEAIRSILDKDWRVCQRDGAIWTAGEGNRARSVTFFKCPVQDVLDGEFETVEKDSGWMKQPDGSEKRWIKNRGERNTLIDTVQTRRGHPASVVSEGKWSNFIYDGNFIDRIYPVVSADGSVRYSLLISYYRTNYKDPVKTNRKAVHSWKSRASKIAAERSRQER